MTQPPSVPIRCPEKGCGGLVALRRPGPSKPLVSVCDRCGWMPPAARARLKGLAS